MSSAPKWNVIVKCIWKIFHQYLLSLFLQPVTTFEHQGSSVMPVTRERGKAHENVKCTMHFQGITGRQHANNVINMYGWLNVFGCGII